MRQFALLVVTLLAFLLDAGYSPGRAQGSSQFAPLDNPAPGHSEKQPDAPSTAAELVRSCDLLAASPLDPDLPADVLGVKPEAIDTATAIPACEAALKAEPDNRRLHFEMGRALGAAQRFAEARPHYERAAQAGMPLAMNNFASLLQFGDGGPKNIDEAIKWYRRAVTDGSAAVLLHWNQGNLRAENAAEGGLAVAMYNLAGFFYRGEGVEQDYVQAQTYYQNALDRGFADAAEPLAFIHRWGRNGPQNVPLALQILQRGAELGCVPCWRLQAEITDDESLGVGDAAQTTASYIKGAQAGDTEAMLKAGSRLIAGTGIAADPASGLTWLEKAQAPGNVAAMGELARNLAKGEGVARDPERAARLLQKVLEVEKEPGKRSKIYPPNSWDYGLILAELHDTKAIRNASASEAARLHARYGKRDGRLIKFTVPIDCTGTTSKLDLYVRDWERDDNPVDEQAQWLKEERGCTIATDVTDSFRKLYKIARDNKVNFTDLAEYALGKKTDDAGQPAGEGQNSAAAAPGQPDTAPAPIAESPAAAAPTQGASAQSSPPTSAGASPDQEACERGDAKTCLALGAKLEKGDGVPVDKPLARNLFQKACDGGEAGGCLLAGVMLADGEGGPVDKPQARIVYAKACEGGHAGGCFLLGAVHDNGEGGPADKAQARGLYQKACDGGNATGCLFLGMAMTRGEGGPADPAGALAFYRKACDGGNDTGCKTFASLNRKDASAHEAKPQAAAEPAQKEEKGQNGLAPETLSQPTQSSASKGPQEQGSILDVAQLGADYLVACWTSGRGEDFCMQRAEDFVRCGNHIATACFTLGVIYSKGEGGPLDLAKARAFFAKACDGGDAGGCGVLGAMHDKGEGGPIDKAQARSFYGKACDGGFAGGCFNLGVMHHKGEGGPIDKAQARSFYGKACDGGDADGCFDLGLMHDNGEGGPIVKAQARGLYAKACYGGDAKGCFNLAWMHHKGEGGPVDKAQARPLYGKACDSGDASGCFNLGAMLHKGEGGPVDMGQARSLFAKACDGGHAGGCFSLGVLCYHGEGGSADKQQARSLFQKACDGGDAHGCKNVKIMKQNGEGKPARGR